jgi:solute carrier family 25 S-adenosylmethionine transporter 26
VYVLSRSALSRRADTASAAGAFFTTYEGVKTLLEHTPLPTPLAHASASAVAELVSCAILTPAEVIKQNAQMASGPSPLARTLASFRTHPSALWTGYGALAARNLPFTALQFPVFERFRSALTERRRRETGGEATLVEHGLVTAVAAGSAGALAAAVTTPVDVIKTRIMLAAGDGARRGSMAFARDIVREQGWRGLFRGGALRCVWTMLGSGLYLGVYESARMYLVQRREK